MFKSISGWLPAAVLAAANLNSAGAQPAVQPVTATDQEIRAQLLPKHITTLAAEVPAVIRQLNVREGERFKKDQLLVGFDCAIQQAQLQKAQAAAKGAAKIYEVDSRLAQLESISELDVEVAAAKLGEARADVALTQATLKKCRIHAPFSGRVAELKAHQHQHLQVGEPIMEILDDSELELKLIVPSLWLRWLKPGQAFQVHIEELDHDFPAKITTLGAHIDPVSQTLPVTGRITGTHSELLAGMSGKAVFAQQAR